MNAARLVLLLAALLTLQVACASRSYHPAPPETVGLFERIETQQQDGLTARAAVPSEAETRKIFGLPLYERGVQPVWIEITNETDERVRYAPVGTDAAYFPAHEVAYMYKGRYKGDADREMTHHLHAETMSRWIWPGETRSGWVFTHLSEGTKAFNVDLFQGSGRHESFSFFLDVPGRAPDHAAIDFQALYDEAVIARLELDTFEAALDRLGCCTTDATGERPGRPLNVVLVGPGRDVLKALLRAGFYERPRAERPEQVELEPHFDGRPPDAVFRTRRSGLGDRNELRVWRAPIVVDGEPVWVARISHYIGSATEFGRALFDDRLDPNISDGRDFMLQTMWYSQSLAKFAWQRVSEPTDVGSPARDFRGRPYFWDGERIVLWLSGDPVSQVETVNVGWDDPPVDRTR